MSESLPWCPLYTSDFLAETNGWFADEVGCYALLLVHQWEHGFIPDDERRLAQITRTDLDRFCEIWNEMLAHKFPPLEAIAKSRAHPFYVERRQEAIEAAAARSLKARAGARAKWGETDGGSPHERRRSRMGEARQRGRHTDEEWVTLKALTGFVCVRCGIPETELVRQRLTKDHVVLVSRGGTDAISNLQPLCRNCNSSRPSDPTDYLDANIRELTVDPLKFEEAVAQIRGRIRGDETEIRPQISMQDTRDQSISTPEDASHLPPPKGQPSRSRARGVTPEGRRMVKPTEPSVELPAQLEPEVDAFVALCARENVTGRIAEGRIAGIRLELRRILEMVQDPRCLAYGLHAALAAGAGNTNYVQKAAVGAAAKPEKITTSPKAALAMKRPPPPPDINTWPEQRKLAWMRENGYA